MPLMEFRSSKLKSHMPSFFDGGGFVKLSLETWMDYKKIDTLNY